MKWLGVSFSLLLLLPGKAKADAFGNPASGSPSFGGSQVTILITTVSFPAGSTNYIQNTSTLESGATFYVSSGTVSGQLFSQSLTISSATNVKGNLSISSTVVLNGSPGTSGQFLQSNGGGTIPSWGTVSGGSGIVSPGTFTWTNNFGISVSTASIGGTFPLLSTSTLQSGATIYASSGTINVLTVSTLTVTSSTTLKGSTDNSEVSPGNIGEYMESIVPIASRINFNASNTIQQMTSLPLTTGDWMIECIIAVAPNTSDMSNDLANILSSVALGTYGDNQFQAQPSTVVDVNIHIGVRKLLSSNTTYYCNGFATYTVGVAQMYGKMFATRRH